MAPALTPAEYRAALPRVAQGDVDAVQTPDRERVRGIPARHVDHVLLGEVLGRPLRSAEEPQAARLAVSERERLEERRDPAVRVAGRRRHEAHARTRCGRQREEVAVERRVSIRHEPAAAHRENVARHALLLSGTRVVETEVARIVETGFSRHLRG